LLPQHLLEPSDLSVKFVPWLRRHPKHRCPRRDIRNDARLCADPRASTNPNMVGHPRLAADLNKILENRRTRNSDLRYDDTTSANDDVVPDLHQVIEIQF
jgi:hypothetical protein